MTTCKNGHEFQFPAYRKIIVNEDMSSAAGQVGGYTTFVPVCPTCGVRV